MGGNIESNLANNCVDLVFVAVGQRVKGFLKVDACYKGKGRKQVVIGHSWTIAESTNTLFYINKLKLTQSLCLLRRSHPLLRIFDT